MRSTLLFIKRLLFKKIWSSSLGMAQCLGNALADKVQKQEVPCTQWYACAVHNNHAHIIQQPSLLLMHWAIPNELDQIFVWLI